MGFLGIGTWEIVLILILALIILGPNKLTDVARTLGKTVRAIRKASNDLTNAVTKELEATRDETPPSHIKQDASAPADEAPATVGKEEKTNHDDQTTKPGEAPAAK